MASKPKYTQSSTRTEVEQVHGADAEKLQTGSSATTATQTMDKILTAKFKPTTVQWDENQLSYHTKAYHLLLNKYFRQDGINLHQDISKTYHYENPITSLSYDRGSILTITDSNNDTKHIGLEDVWSER